MSMGTGSYLNSFLVQESISIMFVALGLSILGIIYGRLKTKDSFHLHRWTMSGAVILTLISIFFVMFPSLYAYYTTDGVDFLSGFSVLQVIHAVVGFPAAVLTVMYLFNDLPKATKKYMRLAIVLWLTSMVLGAVVYYTMPS